MYSHFCSPAFQLQLIGSRIVLQGKKERKKEKENKKGKLNTLRLSL
jgi:hypothetical protein